VCVCLLIEDLHEQIKSVEEGVGRRSRRSKCKQSGPVYPVVAVIENETPTFQMLVVWYCWFTRAQELASLLCSDTAAQRWVDFFKDVCRLGFISKRLNWLLHSVMAKAGMPSNVGTCTPGTRFGCWFPKYDLWLSACDMLPKVGKNGEPLASAKEFMKGDLVHASSLETSGRSSDTNYQPSRKRDQPTAQVMVFPSQIGGLGVFAVGKIREKQWATEYAGRVLSQSEALAMRIEGTDTHIRTLVRGTTHLDGRLQPDFGLDMPYFVRNAQVTVL
jgi:hypothetical protein